MTARIKPGTLVNPVPHTLKHYGIAGYPRGRPTKYPIYSLILYRAPEGFPQTTKELIQLDRQARLKELHFGSVKEGDLLMYLGALKLISTNYYFFLHGKDFLFYPYGFAVKDDYPNFTPLPDLDETFWSAPNVHED